MRQHTFLRFPTSAKASLLLLASFVYLGTATAQVKYEIVAPEVLGKEISNAQSRGNEINENGETLLNRLATFAIWQDGKTTKLIDARSDYGSSFSRLTASSINAHGQVVGSKTYLVDTDSGSRFDTIPFYWDAQNGLVDLDDLSLYSASGVGHTTLYGINAKGVAIGSSRAYEGDEERGNHAFTWSFDQGRVEIAPLDVFDGTSFTQAHSLNDHGVVVGIYREFLDSSDAYHERGFLANPAAEVRDLSEIDPAFFAAESHTARAINNNGQLVGERGRDAYIYDTKTGKGSLIDALSENGGATRAYAVNNKGVVAGYGEVRDASGKLAYAPLLWTEQTGSVDLSAHLSHSSQSVLPSGSDLLDFLITPKRINGKGQISAQLKATSGQTFSREVILNPTLDFQWSSIAQTSENGVSGVLYSYRRNKASETLPASALGLEIQFLCSTDMNNWNHLDVNAPGVRLERSADAIDLFVPFSECGFIKPILAEIQ